MQNIRQSIILALVSFVLAACGSGGGSGSEPAGTNPVIPEEAGKVTLTAKKVSQASEILLSEIYIPVSFFEGIRADYTSPMPTFNFQNGSGVQNCSSGGTVNTEVSQNGASVKREFSNCVLSDGDKLNGIFSYVITNVSPATNTYTLTVTHNNYSVVSSDQSVTFDGTTRIDARFDNASNIYLNVESRRSIDSSEIGEKFTATPLTYSAHYVQNDADNLTLSEVSGVIEMSQSGGIDVSWIESQQRVLILGGGTEKGYLKLNQNDFELEFINAGGEAKGARINKNQPFNAFSDNVAPVFTENNSLLVNSGESASLSFNTWVSDANFDALNVTISVVTTPEGAVYELSPKDSYSYSFSSETAGEFIVKLSAVDPEGLSAEGIISLRVVLDTDGDGLIDSVDNDDDGDGVNDDQDKFPLDNSESADTDGDGIGNNADTDDDNDGVIDTVDLFPVDAQCSTAYHSIGGRCISVVAAESDEIAVDEASGIIYLLAKSENAIIRWNTADSSFMDTIELGGATQSSATAVQMSLSAAHNRLYFGYDNGSITYLSLAGGSETSLLNLPLEVGGLVAVGEFMLAQDASGAWNTHYIIDDTGLIKDQKEWNRYSRTYTWDSQYNRIYYFRDETSPNDLHYEEIDQITGVILSEGETPHHGDHDIVPPIIVSESDGSVLIGSGNIFSQSALDWMGAVTGDIVDGVWSADGLVLIRTVGDKTVLERRGDNLAVIEQVEFSGVGKAIVHTSNGYSVLTVKDNGLIASDYTPSNDTDGDTVPNAEDAFPLDIAASLDSDHDGYPDAWNAGYSQADSTTGLSLDAYPTDSACHLQSQGDGTSCDYSQVIPVFTPDKVVSDESGIIYMLSGDNNRIYRWSMAANDYIAPIVIGNDAPIGATRPTLMEYSAVHNRLYFGYDTGQVSYLDLNDLGAGEQSYATVSMSVRGLAAVGNYVLVQDESGAWATHYIFSKAGNLTDSRDWNAYSRAYAWNDELNRVYFFDDDSSPNDLYYEDIDQATGKIIANGDSPYHGDYNISPPILVTSTNGIILGAGNIYNATSLEWKGSLTSSFEHGVVLGNGNLLTLRELNGLTRLDAYNPTMTWVSEKDYVGLPIGIFEKGGNVYIVTKTTGGLSFYQH